jgi:hypothetical protein
MSPISSRKSVAPSAISNFPFFDVIAPENAPFAWPNSSDSTRSSGIAAEFISTNGEAFRFD